MIFITYIINYNAQNKQTSDSFNADNIAGDMLNKELNLPHGITVTNIGVKSKCGGNEMPSFEKVKSQNLNNLILTL